MPLPLMPCGHSIVLAVQSAEPPHKLLYCDLCNEREEKSDALVEVAELKRKVEELEGKLAAVKKLQTRLHETLEDVYRRVDMSYDLRLLYYVERILGVVE